MSWISAIASALLRWTALNAKLKPASTASRRSRPTTSRSAALSRFPVTCRSHGGDENPRSRRAAAIVGLVVLSSPDGFADIITSSRVACAIANPESIPVARLTCGWLRTGHSKVYPSRSALQRGLRTLSLGSGARILDGGVTADARPELPGDLRQRREDIFLSPPAPAAIENVAVRQFRARSPSTYWL
jgi:hypothetical protein